MASSTAASRMGMLAPVHASPPSTTRLLESAFSVTAEDINRSLGVGDMSSVAGGSLNVSIPLQQPLAAHNIVGLSPSLGARTSLGAAAPVMPATSTYSDPNLNTSAFTQSQGQVQALKDWGGGIAPELYGPAVGPGPQQQQAQPPGVPLSAQPPPQSSLRQSRSPLARAGTPPSAQFASGNPPPRGVKRPREDNPHAPHHPSHLRSSIQHYPQQPPTKAPFLAPGPLPHLPSHPTPTMSVNSNASEPVYRNPTNFTDIPRILPHEKVFSIQIGNELFRLSGASISSDAPSYFTQFFEQELAKLSQAEFDNMGNGPGAPGKPPHQIKTLYIDRDPETFKDIARHLQGYHITPTDAQHFVRLFADAQFYSLPKLISQLFESDIFITIGGVPFRIPREVFSQPGDSQNFFSLGISINFSPENELFPGLNREGLLRPPSIQPPNVPNRSGAVFAELLHMLRGYPVKVRNEEHRQELLRDCRYFLFKGLEQRLIAHSISWNPKRQREEIVLRIEDIKRSGISVVADPNGQYSWVNYSRPFMAEPDRELLLEIGGEATKIDWKTRRAEFTGDTNARVAALFQVVANKLNLPTNRPLGTYMMNPSARERGNSPGSTPLSDDKVKIRIERDCHIVLDGEEYNEASAIPLPLAQQQQQQSLQQANTPQPTDPEELPSADDSRTNAIGSPSWHQQQAQQVQQTPRPSPANNPNFRRRPGTLRRRGSMEEQGIWIVKRAQWRLKVQDVVQKPGANQNKGEFAPQKEIVLYGAKIEALSGEYGRNSLRGFLV